MAQTIIRAEPEAIIVLTNWLELIETTRALRQREILLPLYSWMVNVTQETARKGGALLEGMKGFTTVVTNPLADSPNVRRFRETLSRLFPDQEPDFLSLHAFGNATVFTEALGRVEAVLDAVSLIEAFYSLQAFETGILPPVTFAPHRHLGTNQVQPVRSKVSGHRSAPCSRGRTQLLDERRR